jgi:hypothetical protein
MELQKRHWVQEVERWKKSGLSKSEFCRQEGIHRGTFSTWWRRYKEQRAEDESGGFVELRPVVEEKRREGRHGSEYPAEICAGGLCVKLNANADRPLIENIFKALEARQCS